MQKKACDVDSHSQGNRGRDGSQRTVARLLSNSFRPPAQVLAMRTYWRLRAEHVREVSTTILRMQKALTQMNIQLANVISDISGVSGMAIIRAIV